MKMNMREKVQRVNEQGQPAGVLDRAIVHDASHLLHHVVHVLVFDGRGRLLLQKRSKDKGLGPGLWDVSVGGHRIPGETPVAAAARKSEYVSTFRCCWNGPFNPDSREVEALRYLALEELDATCDGNTCTENFKAEVRRLREHLDGA